MRLVLVTLLSLVIASLVCASSAAAASIAISPLPAPANSYGEAFITACGLDPDLTFEVTTIDPAGAAFIQHSGAVNPDGCTYAAPMTLGAPGTYTAVVKQKTGARSNVYGGHWFTLATLTFQVQ